MYYMGLLLIIIFSLYIDFISIRNILIAKDKIHNSAVIQEQKKKSLYKRGLLGLIVSLVCGVFLVYIFIIVVT